MIKYIFYAMGILSISMLYTSSMIKSRLQQIKEEHKELFSDETLRQPLADNEVIKESDK